MRSAKNSAPETLRRQLTFAFFPRKSKPSSDNRIIEVEYVVKRPHLIVALGLDALLTQARCKNLCIPNYVKIVFSGVHASAA